MVGNGRSEADAGCKAQRGLKIVFNLKFSGIMLVDFILDRMEGIEYDPRELYNYCQEEEAYWGVARALDGGTEEDVKSELCGYILGNGYNPEICGYISSVDWL